MAERDRRDFHNGAVERLHARRKSRLMLVLGPLLAAIGLAQSVARKTHAIAGIFAALLAISAPWERRPVRNGGYGPVVWRRLQTIIREPRCLLLAFAFFCLFLPDFSR